MCKIYIVLFPDVINPTTLLSACKEKLSSLTIRQIQTLSEKLDVVDAFASKCQAPVDELLFHVLYNWHCRNPTATMKKLALMLKECKLTKQAFQLDKECE